MSAGFAHDESAPADAFDQTARRLADMASLVSSGLSPDEAALRVRVQEEDPEPPHAVTLLGDPRDLARVAVGFDADGLTRLLEEAFSLGDYEEVVDGWLLPSLQELGNAWQEGRVNVAEEHFASASVHRRLARAYEETPVPLHAPRVLIGLAPGSRHELGVLAFATALRRQRVDTVYLGSDVPVDAWVGALRSAPDAAVLAVPSAEDVLAAREVVTALDEAAPGMPVLVGGSHQALVSDGVTLLGHHIFPAAERLAAALRAKV